ncbi:MAG: peptidoglycan DD-metalloendopeptidase family protein [Desulfohalobiaceae bacterium]|nr:peptidoglycan DD-metalloendopeptidase family protein [Desulfohalobiaceae bacterium]
MQKEKRLLEKLSARERALYSNLTEIEDRINNLLSRKKSQAEKLNQAAGKMQELEKSVTALQTRVREQRSELQGMLEQLWTLYLHNRNKRFRDFRAWAESDLQLTWLSAIYRSAGDKLERLRAREKELNSSLAKQKRVRAEIQEQLELFQATQDKLLQSRLVFLRQLQKIRAQKLAKEEQMAQIKETIQELEYKLKTFETKQIADLKGSLPWPVQGGLSRNYNPDSKPPLDGLAFSTKKGAGVQSIFWGKIVYSDVLRGFGKVVVIFHGKQYYSLYAFLSRAVVTVGQDVEKGEIIGYTGYYPLVDGPGLYFELRLGQSPVNPGLWLAETG